MISPPRVDADRGLDDAAAGFVSRWRVVSPLRAVRSAGVPGVQVRTGQVRTGQGPVDDGDRARPVALSDHLAGRNVILLNCFDEEHDFPAVLPDDRAGGAAAVGLAAAAGHRRIALLGGEQGTWPAMSRLAGYRDALAKAGIPFDRALVRDGNWHADSGYDQARKVLRLRDPATALVCGNDRMALGAYDAIKELGLTIPGDVSVIGYDDQREIVAYTRPPLTTMRLPCYEMGGSAVSAILDGRSFRREMLRCEPVPRGSLGPVRTAGSTPRRS